MKYILCIDAGTSVVKAMLFDLDGNIRKISSRTGDVENPKPNYYELDLDAFYQHLCAAIAEVIEGYKASDIIAVGVSAYMAGTIFLDKNKKEIGKSVLWIDGRTAPYFKQWDEDGRAAKLFELSGTSMLAGHTLALLYWWKHNDPAMLERAHHCLFTKDWIRYKLTGELCTDSSEASCIPADTFNRSYSPEIMELFGLSGCMGMFPPIMAPEAVAGHVTHKAADDTGLAAGTPVVCGLGDMLAGILGSGAIEAGQGSTIIGSTLLNGIIQDTPNSTPNGIGMTLATVDNKWARLVNNTGGGTINFQWAFDLFTVMEQQSMKGDFYSWVDEEIDKVPPCAHGVMYHPYINSTGVTAPFHNVNARAQFVGIGMHHTRFDMLRAVFEGIGLSIRDCYNAVPDRVTELRVTGGGSRDDTLCQIVSDCMGVSLILPKEAQSTALGTAILAAVGTGEYDSIEEAVAQMVHIKKEYHPNPQKQEIYRKWYELYKEIRTVMMPVWNQRRTVLTDIGES